MSTTAAVEEQRVILTGISWETYERLMEERGEGSNPRFTYDDGWLEIMSPHAAHESIGRLASIFVHLLSEEWGFDVTDLGSTTYKVKDWGKGFEPDACFYLGEAAVIRELERIDPLVDPPPDIAVEVDYSTSSLPKQPVFARFRVPEVWRWDRDGAHVLLLEGDRYREVEHSRALPGLDAAALTRLLGRGRELSRREWSAEVRTWAGSVSR
jgi:Uma2 family endonuclease